MALRNDTERYGLVARTLHWLVALLVPCLFGLGLYMTSLTYYDPLYRTLPAIHKGIGLLLFALVAARISWRSVSPPPPASLHHSVRVRRAAHTVHLLLYALLVAMTLSGYLIATADGRPLTVFEVEVLPSIVSGEHLEDTAGAAHLALGITLVALVLLHALAALKHHFIDRDRTLLRMLGR
jgi:cytochrome b561